MAVFIEQRFVAAGRNEPAVKKKFGSERINEFGSERIKLTRQRRG